MTFGLREGRNLRKQLLLLGEGELLLRFMSLCGDMSRNRVLVRCEGKYR